MKPLTLTVDEPDNKVAMYDDFNTPIVISHLFDATKTINSIVDKKETITPDALEALKDAFKLFAFDLLGIKHATVRSKLSRALAKMKTFLEDTLPFLGFLGMKTKTIVLLILLYLL